MENVHNNLPGLRYDTRMVTFALRLNINKMASSRVLPRMSLSFT